MKGYTIGILFTDDYKQVLLINKLNPEWQKGKMNFPGGKKESGETFLDCVSREFEEETSLKIHPSEWFHIGAITGLEYEVAIFTTTYYPPTAGEAKDLTDEKLSWVECDKLPENVISNLRWLVPFALNYCQQGNADILTFGNFIYK